MTPIATIPDGGPILGFAQVVNPDNSITTIIQTEKNTYSWDGNSTFVKIVAQEVLDPEVGGSSPPGPAKLT